MKKPVIAVVLGLAAMGIAYTALRNRPVDQTSSSLGSLEGISARAETPVIGITTEIKAKEAPAASAEMTSPKVLEFRSFLKETHAQMPKQSDLRKLTTQQAHHFPAPLEKAGALMGEIAERLEKDPSLTPEAVKFYAGCALDDQLPSSVRALCLANYTKRDPKAPHLNVPENIKRVAQSLNF
ncbi:MAG: hypothetical protein JST16_06995 [Bdellovibrionales bacterium]|nr:hypothetical protein [Bdellovibrionales bacterium]